MVHNDQSLFGTYVGLVLATEDPDNLGRVKVIVPGKTGPLFEGWNERIKDITFTTASEDIFSPDILNRLLGVLPWARPSSPIFGGGSGSPVNSSSGKSSTIPTDQTFNPTTGTPPTSVDHRTVGDDQINNVEGKQGPATPVESSSPTSEAEARAFNLIQRNGKNYISLQDMHKINAYNVSQSGLVGYVPKDGPAHGITKGTQEEWTAYFDKQVYTESTVINGLVPVGERFREKDNTISEGVYSLTVGEKGLTQQTIQDPFLNSKAAIGISADYIKGDGVISGIAGYNSKGNPIWLGQARYFGPVQRGEVDGVGPGGYVGQAVSRVVQRTTNMFQNMMGSLNMGRSGGPIGSFSLPVRGSKVWVTFEGGNPQRPIYMGQVYEPSNINSHA